MSSWVQYGCVKKINKNQFSENQQLDLESEGSLSKFSISKVDGYKINKS
ncbi:hypothetical protein ACJJIF_12165 [Microbulbifer sp. SSSA002]